MSSSRESQRLTFSSWIGSLATAALAIINPGDCGGSPHRLETKTNRRDSGNAAHMALLILLLAVLLSLSGCGGGTTPTSPHSDPTLISITVTPNVALIVVGDTQQFSAMGTYSDASTKDITSSVSWISSDTTKATIETSGVASGIAGGSVTITGALGGRSGVATLTISPVPTSVSISPLDPTIAAGGTQKFFATATFSDSSIQDVTKFSTWTSSASNVAAIQSTGQPNPGLATGLVAGSTTVTAGFGGKSGSSTLTVTSSGGNGTPIPLMDMTPAENYLSFQGGLYENSTNLVPADHDSAGLAAAAAIQPLDANGNPSPSGRIVFVSIGRSNAVGEFAVFIGQATANSSVNHTTLVTVNGALTSAAPCVWTVAYGPPPCDPTLGNQYDRIRDTVLAPAGVTEKQVQIAWIEEYDADPGNAGFQTLCDPTIAGCSNDVSHTEAVRFEQELGNTMRAAKTRWPNLQQAFHSSRIYGGYSTTDHNSEPYPYEYGFSVKWLIEAQILQMRNGIIDPVAGDLNDSNGTVPWAAWGPYLWANGDTPRLDGLFWCNGQIGPPCNGEVDFLADGTHPNTQGQQKVANLLMNFFLGSTYTPWFRP